jgi:CRP-like cAMP-binding protein
MAQTVTTFDIPRNRILSSLPDEEVDLVLSMLEPEELAFGQVLIESDHPIEYVHFPERALVSMLGAADDSAAVEVAMIGRDGMVGLPLFFGLDRTLMRGYVQIAGSAWRMTAEHFRALLYQSATLERMVRRYAHASFFFAAQSSACNRLHNVMQRSARWLLTTQDAVGAPRFRITHLVLAQMLGVRRATVTETAGLLQRAGHIAYNRGQVQIVDRPGLEEVSCSCYALIRREQERAMSDREVPVRADVTRVAPQPRSVVEDASSHLEG